MKEDERKGGGLAGPEQACPCQCRKTCNVVRSQGTMGCTEMRFVESLAPGQRTGQEGEEEQGS